MNRKEASFILANIDRRVCDDELNEAFDMAIKALDKEPCGDAIDRAEAIKIASGYCHPANVAKELAKLPSVNPQPKTGHWIFQDITQGKRMWCSNCNSAFDLCCNQIKRYDEATKKEYLWGHCPWCGARMVESQERSGEE